MAGCAGNAVPLSEVEDQTASSLEQLLGERPDVDRPDGLEAEVGTQMTRAVSLGSDPDAYEVHLTVTGVEDDTAVFEIEAAELSID